MWMITECALRAVSASVRRSPLWKVLGLGKTQQSCRFLPRGGFHISKRRPSISSELSFDLSCQSYCNIFAPRGSDDLDPNRQSLAGEANGDNYCGPPGHIVHICIAKPLIRLLGI